MQMDGCATQVASVKQKIEELEPGYQQNLQRIVLGGKILADNAIITDRLGPKEFPVCILKKASAQVRNRFRCPFRTMMRAAPSLP